VRRRIVGRGKTASIVDAPQLESSTTAHVGLIIVRPGIAIVVNTGLAIKPFTNTVVVSRIVGPGTTACIVGASIFDYSITAHEGLSIVMFGSAKDRYLNPSINTGILSRIVDPGTTACVVAALE